MSLFTIDPQKCKRDGICVAECPFGLLEMKTKDDLPSPITEADDICFNCGHCVAVCPEGALSLDSMSASECIQLKKELSVSTESIAQLLKGRRSVRKYKDKPVDKKTIQELLDIARYAPTGHNTQKVVWQVIYDADQVQRLKGLAIDWMRDMKAQNSPLGELLPFEMFINTWDQGIDTLGHGAPHLVLANAPESYPVAQIDCTIALTYLELAAHVMGLGVCWAGAFNLAARNYVPLKEALGMPKGIACFGSMMLGYPKYKYYRIPKRKKLIIDWL